MKLLLTILFTILITATAFAGSVGLPPAHSDNALPYRTDPINLLTNATSLTTGPSSTYYNFVGTPISRFTCQISWTGPIPSSTQTIVEGSIDGSVWQALATVTTSTAPYMFHIADKPVTYIRGNNSVISGGTSTTKLSLKCIGGN